MPELFQVLHLLPLYLLKIMITIFRLKNNAEKRKIQDFIHTKFLVFEWIYRLIDRNSPTSAQCLKEFQMMAPHQLHSSEIL